MANMINLNSKRKLSYYSEFETRSLNVLELIEIIFGPLPINPVNIEDSLINENWPRFKIFSDVILLLILPSSRVSCLVLM